MDEQLSGENNACRLILLCAGIGEDVVDNFFKQEILGEAEKVEMTVETLLQEFCRTRNVSYNHNLNIQKTLHVFGFSEDAISALGMEGTFLNVEEARQWLEDFFFSVKWELDQGFEEQEGQ